MKPTIEIKNFIKYYADFKAVDIKYLSVYPGEILALLGPNGAGKTTTLETLEGLREASSGELTINDLNVKTDYHKIRKLIGVQLQSQSLPPSITIKEAMELFCGYYQVKPRVDLLERFDLKEIENRQFGNLSIGQQRKLALAIAMAHEPEILILDEPTAGLDVNIKAELHEVLKELREKGCSIILSSHDMFEIEKLADRIAILLNGEIITIATPTEIKNTYNLIKMNVKTMNASLLNGFSNEYMVNPIKNQDYMEFSMDIKNVHQLLNEMMNYLDEHHDQIIDINIEKSSLEERFISLTNKVEETL